MTVPATERCPVIGSPVLLFALILVLLVAWAVLGLLDRGGRG